MPGDPLSRPLIEIARELRDRRMSARELVEAAIARHERFGVRRPEADMLGFMTTTSSRNELTDDSAIGGSSY